VDDDLYALHLRGEEHTLVALDRTASRGLLDPLKISPIPSNRQPKLTLAKNLGSQTDSQAIGRTLGRSQVKEVTFIISAGPDNRDRCFYDTMRQVRPRTSGTPEMCLLR